LVCFVCFLPKRGIGKLWGCGRLPPTPKCNVKTKKTAKEDVKNAPIAKVHEREEALSGIKVTRRGRREHKIGRAQWQKDGDQDVFWPSQEAIAKLTEGVYGKNQRDKKKKKKKKDIPCMPFPDAA